MSRNFATLVAAVVLVACGGTDRHSDSPAPGKSSGGAGPGITSAPPAEPDTFDPPPATRNPARRPWSEELAEMRSNLVSVAAEPTLGEGGRGGSGGSALGGVLGGSRPGGRGGSFSRGGTGG